MHLDIRMHLGNSGSAGRPADRPVPPMPADTPARAAGAAVGTAAARTQAAKPGAARTQAAKPGAARTKAGSAVVRTQAGRAAGTRAAASRWYPVSTTLTVRPAAP